MKPALLFLLAAALLACGRVAFSFSGTGPVLAVPIERVRAVTSDGGAEP